MGSALLTVAEVAAHLKCHPHTVRRWIWSQKLNAVKVGDLVRIPEEELARMLEPAQAQGARRRKSSARALLSTMRRLGRVLDPSDVELMEQRIREAERSADWSDPLA